jgi:glycosyltransferase involved in cell wall biosynthesis
MNIVHIYKDYYPVLGGMENHIKDLAEAQVRAGHSVTVLVTQVPGKPAEQGTLNGVRVIKARRQLNVQSAPIAFSFPREVARNTSGADIVHLHAPYPIGEMCNLWFGRGRKTIISWQSDIVRQKTLLKVYAPVLRRVVARADRILPSSDIYARTSPWLRDQLHKCTAVPLGIDAGRFARTPESKQHAAALRASWLAQVPQLRDPLVLLSAGRFRYYKGLGDLIRAMPSVPNAIAVLVGNGPMETEWKSLAQSLNVADRVLFPGSPSNDALPAYFQAADVFAFPSNSRAEAFGIAMLEAMASGLPAISTEVGSATSWINQDGVTGLVIPPEDPAALARAIEQLRGPDFRAKAGNAARQRVRDEFTRERMVTRVMQAYKL